MQKIYFIPIIFCTFLMFSACQNFANIPSAGVQTVLSAQRLPGPSFAAFFPVPQAGLSYDFNFIAFGRVLYEGTKKGQCTNAVVGTYPILKIHQVTPQKITYSFLAEIQETPAANFWPVILTTLLDNFLIHNEFDPTQASFRWENEQEKMVNLPGHGNILVTPIKAIVQLGSKNLTAQFYASRSQGLISFRAKYNLQISNPAPCQIIETFSLLDFTKTPPVDPDLPPKMASYQGH